MKRFLHLLCLGLFALAANAASPESAGIAEARELLDSYYGQSAKLEKAARLVDAAYRANPRDAHVFLTAARITVMRAGLASGDHAPDVWKAYDGLLDRAIALDPALPKAYILKAEIARDAKRHHEAVRLLDKAKALGTDDPWLQIGYAESYRRMQRPGTAYEALEHVVERGPGTTASQRKAYVTALRLQVHIRVDDEQLAVKMRRNADLALAARHPDDAWTPHNFANVFLDHLLFEDAIRHAREALKTRDFGAGRLTLASALYASAARLRMVGEPEANWRPMVEEAARMKIPRERILDHLLVDSGIDGNMELFRPSLEQIVR